MDSIVANLGISLGYEGQELEDFIFKETEVERLVVFVDNLFEEDEIVPSIDSNLCNNDIVSKFQEKTVECAIQQDHRPVERKRKKRRKCYFCKRYGHGIKSCVKMSHAQEDPKSIKEVCESKGSDFVNDNVSKSVEEDRCLHHIDNVGTSGINSLNMSETDHFTMLSQIDMACANEEVENICENSPELEESQGEETLEELRENFMVLCCAMEPEELKMNKHWVMNRLRKIQELEALEDVSHKDFEESNHETEDKAIYIEPSSLGCIFKDHSHI